MVNSLPELTYFDVEAAAEKVRLSYVMCNVEFSDKRINFPEWADLKPTTPFGQLPVLELTDGQKYAQSGAMCRYVCVNHDVTKTLYPIADPARLLQIEEMIGLVEDFRTAFSPGLYLGMGFHTNFGHPEDFPDKTATVKRVRENFCKEQFPKLMGFFTNALLKANGNQANIGFLCGKDVTLADLYMLQQLRYFKKGVADHVPTDIVDPYPEICSYLDRLYAVPQIKGWYKM